ncbi:MAG TPA: carboxypeptidase-like regulatory domain-containing protein [Acidobacteriaceae bacterium]
MLCVWLTFSSALWGQALVGPEQLKPRTISGLVVNSLTDQPISHALVQFGQRAVLTDTEGHFELTDVNGYGVPSATKPGYFPEDIGPAVMSSPPADSQSGPVEIRLVPEAIVSGHVTDSGGEPLEGIPVSLRTLAVSNGLKYWQTRNSATTNAEGEFRIAELPAGEYAIQTSFTQDGAPDGEAAAGYVPVNYPVMGANGAGALKIHAGDHLEVDLSTHLEPLYPVPIAVSGAPEHRWSNFTVRTADGAEINPSLRRNPETGEVRMFLPSGTFELRVEGFEPAPNSGNQLGGTGVNPVRLFASRSVTVTQGQANHLQLTLEPMATVGVEISQEKVATTANPQSPAMPPEGPRSSAEQAPPIGIGLVSTESDRYPTAYYAERPGAPAHFNRGTVADGPLLIHNLPPGKYMLQAQTQPPWYVASALCGGTDLTREPLVIAGSAGGCTISVVLRDNTSSMKLSVSGGSGTAIAYIYAIPLGNLTRDTQTFTTSSDGRASLDGLPPGQYLLLAMRYSAQLAFRDPESLRRYETLGKRVELAPGGGADVQLDAVDEEPQPQ